MKESTSPHSLHDNVLREIVKDDNIQEVLRLLEDKDLRFFLDEYEKDFKGNNPNSLFALLVKKLDKESRGIIANFDSAKECILISNFNKLARIEEGKRKKFLENNNKLVEDIKEFFSSIKPIAEKYKELRHDIAKAIKEFSTFNVIQLLVKVKNNSDPNIISEAFKFLRTLTNERHATFCKHFGSLTLVPELFKYLKENSVQAQGQSREPSEELIDMMSEELFAMLIEITGIIKQANLQSFFSQISVLNMIRHSYLDGESFNRSYRTFKPGTVTQPKTAAELKRPNKDSESYKQEVLDKKLLLSLNKQVVEILDWKLAAQTQVVQDKNGEYKIKSQKDYYIAILENYIKDLVVNKDTTEHLASFISGHTELAELFTKNMDALTRIAKRLYPEVKETNAQSTKPISEAFVAGHPGLSPVTYPKPDILANSKQPIIWLGKTWNPTFNSDEKVTGWQKEKPIKETSIISPSFLEDNDNNDDDVPRRSDTPDTNMDNVGNGKKISTQKGR